MSLQIPDAVSWCLVAGAPVGAALLARQRRITGTLRSRVGRLENSLQARDAEARHLATVLVPALAAGGPVPERVPADGRLAGTEYARHVHSVVEQVGHAADRARARADQAARIALMGAVRSLQGLANEQQLAISAMQDRHDDPRILGDLLEIDHTNSQFGRRAQAIAVLCGSWPGRQRRASPLSDVVRGAKSRVRDYRRVQLGGDVDLAVTSRVVEPVVLALAELLDNAARHSQPNTTVQVNLAPAHNGACIVVDDAGVGMEAREVERASHLMSGARPAEVTLLGDPPQFGFAVIGVLAAKYGFHVSVDTRSPYGGVRAVVFLPGRLLVPLDHPAESMPVGAGHGTDPAAGFTGTPPPQHRPTPGGLPRRRRRSAAPDANPEATTGGEVHGTSFPADDMAVRTAEEAARRLGAFTRGTRAGRADQNPEGNRPA
ncbi:ATP-binding protein [Streptomyces sp. NPDC048514]|uniref:ATP-binding protein n=1 Tax=Streptomyces sp. NPDC048514 TaxID=3365564 RepID=UPI003717246D